MESWWKSVEGRHLAQGDLLPDCFLPIFAGKVDGYVEESVSIARLIVMTQSCDLENGKVKFVSLCPIHSISEFEESDPNYKKEPERWERIRKGQVASLHLLTSPTEPDSNWKCYVVDFGQIISLPIDYITDHAQSLGTRYRLKSPFLEHFSQAFARFFMRVGLPSGIAQFKKK